MRPVTLDLRQLTRDLIQAGWQRGDKETGADNEVLCAIREGDRDIEDRKRSVVSWLNRYRVLMFWPPANSLSTAAGIIEFADTREQESLHLDKEKIVAEFDRLHERIKSEAPRTPAGDLRGITSLTSKALWCCYPSDVPIFDANALRALEVLSRICGIGPAPGQSEFASFVDVWLQMYKEVEPVIQAADLSDCPYKVRVLDRLLWYLGQPGFWQAIGDSAAV